MALLITCGSLYPFYTNIAFQAKASVRFCCLSWQIDYTTEELKGNQ